MINKTQYLLLKQYATKPMKAESNSTFHSLSFEKLIDTKRINNEECYVATNKGLAEIENYEKDRKNSIVGYVALGVGIFSIILTIFFKFVV